MSALLKTRELSEIHRVEKQTPLVEHFELLATSPNGVARLRELILTLAVQGKLVRQDPGDEPADVPLALLREAKEQLIAKEKLKREKLPTKHTENPVTFELPTGWRCARLTDIVRVLNGRAYAKSELLDVGTPVLRVGNLFTSNHWYYSNLNLAPEKYCRHGDLLFAWSASFGPFIWEGPDAIYHYHIWKLEPFRLDAFNSRYFHTFLLEKTAEIKAAGHGVSMVHMTKEKMEKIVVSYPPLAEQSRIVARVEELMRLCNALEAKGRLEAAQHRQLVTTLLGTLTDSESPEALSDRWRRIAEHFDILLDRPEAVDALEQTILELAVRGLLIPQDPSDKPASVLLASIQNLKSKLIADGKMKRGTAAAPISDDQTPFEIPDDWEWVRIDDIAEVQGGIQKTPLRRPVRSHHPYLRVANVQRDAFVLGEIERFELSDADLAKWRLSSGDLLIVEGNGSENEVGRCAVWTGQIDPCVYQNHLIRVRCSQPECVEYLKLFLNSASGMTEMKRLAITTSGLYNLSVGKIRNFVVPMPSLTEQSRIVARAEELRRVCLDLRQRLIAAKTTQAQLAELLAAQPAP